MIMRAIGHLLGILLSLACIFIVLFLTLRQSEKADSRFEINMLKDINRIGKDLKETKLEEKTVQTIKYALEDVQWNVESYVNEKSLWEFLSVMFLVPMFMAFFESVRRMSQKNQIT